MPTFAYTDGSNQEDKRAAGAAVIVTDGSLVAILKKEGRKAEYLSSRNIYGEIIGAYLAIEWAKANSVKITIVHDLQGIAEWALGTWKRNTPLTEAWHAYYTANASHVTGFTWVKGHSGDTWNDRADKVAKSVLGIT